MKLTEAQKEMLLAQIEATDFSVIDACKKESLAVEKGVTIEAQEKRNRSALETVFRMKRTEMKQVKRSNTAALQYYKSMSKINEVDPQLMDKKK